MWKKARVFSALVLAALLLTLSVAAEGLANLPELPENQCVVDAANMLSPETEQWLDQYNGELQRTCQGACIAVLTVDDVAPLSVADYATEAFNEWCVGARTENNGVLLLLSRTSPKHPDGDYYAVLGDGLDSTRLSSELSHVLQTNLEDLFAEANYDAAVEQTVPHIGDIIQKLYEEGEVHPMPDSPKPKPKPAPRPTSWSERFYLIAVLGAIYFKRWLLQLFFLPILAGIISGNFSVHIGGGHFHFGGGGGSGSGGSHGGSSGGFGGFGGGGSSGGFSGGSGGGFGGMGGGSSHGGGAGR